MSILGRNGNGTAPVAAVEAEPVAVPIEHIEANEHAREVFAHESAGLIARLLLLWKSRRQILKVTLAGMAAAVVLSFVLPNKYQSTARLMPPEGTGGLSKALMLSGAANATSGGLGMLAGDLFGMKSSGALFVGILRSATVQDRIIDRFDLRKVYWKSTYFDARRKLSENTHISEERKSGIITITVTDHSPERAAEMARAYVEELDRLSAQVTTSAAHRERMFIEERLQVVSTDLDRAARDFGEFSSKNATLDLKEQGRAMLEAAARVQGELIAAQSELKGLEQIYTGNNVRVRYVKARIAELERELRKLANGSEGSATAGASDTNYPSIRKLPLLGASYADLYRKVKVQEAVYETLVKQYELAKIEEAREIPSVRVLDEAKVPEKKSAPKRLMLILLLTAAAFGIAVMVVLARARWSSLDPGDSRKLAFAGVWADAKMDWASIPKGRVSKVDAR